MSGDSEQDSGADSVDMSLSELQATVEAQQAQIDFLTEQVENLRTQPQRRGGDGGGERGARGGRQEPAARNTPTQVFDQNDPRSWGGEATMADADEVNDDADGRQQPPPGDPTVADANQVQARSGNAARPGTGRAAATSAPRAGATRATTTRR